MFRFEIDKKGILSAVEMALLGCVIVISGQSIAREIVWLWVPEPTDAVILGPVADSADENVFYLQPPSAAPVFLTGEEIRKKYQGLVWEGRDFFLADLDRGVVVRFEGGAVHGEFPILAESTDPFSRVPQGIYTVQGRAERHTARASKEQAPWTVYLYGNYLIHGASAGAKTRASGLGIGGITLENPHARDVYEHAREGLPVLVLRQDTPSGIMFSYTRKNNLPHRVPEVTAAAALAADLETGAPLFEKNKNDAYPTASLTKLMTAVIAMEDIDPQKILAVTDEALRTYGDSGGLVRGETFRAGDLLRGLILPSSNDAAVVYQLSLPGFLDLLNTKAGDLGLDRTYFEDASGLSKNNVTSAGDLISLLQYISNRHPDLLALSREPVASRMSENKKKQHYWSNVNWPRGDSRYGGGKAGFTDDSLQTMAGVWNVRVAEYGGRKIAIALLGSRDRVRDVRAIINYLEQDFIYGFAFLPGTAGSQAVSASVREAVK